MVDVGDDRDVPPKGIGDYSGGSCEPGHPDSIRELDSGGPRERESWGAGELESGRAGELESGGAGELESGRAGSWRPGELGSAEGSCCFTLHQLPSSPAPQLPHSPVPPLPSCLPLDAEFARADQLAPPVLRHTDDTAGW
jgi:hypothetical protein